jgi:nickel-dependent lactate racemase
MMLFEVGSPSTVLTDADLRAGLFQGLERLGARTKVLALPPDGTRAHARAGELTRFAYEFYGDALTDIMPALGTHVPMTPQQLHDMFGDLPLERFRPHRWREEIVTLGEVPAEFVREVSEGAVDYAWPAQVNRLLTEGGHDLILSIGQVVPHEVVGMANHSKNLFVGTGGAEGIHKSHFLGAAYGMERMMGRADTPVRRVLDYAAERIAPYLPVVYVLTVVEACADGHCAVRGLFIGDDRECFEKAAALSRQVNVFELPQRLERAVVWLDPHAYHSTWLGNKAIYRTRMAMADGGELVVLAPGARMFGEDPEIDRLIRQHGYCGTPAVRRAMEQDEALRRNLSAAAHLIHGSSEGRFKITYCPGHLSRAEIESAGFAYEELSRALERFRPQERRDGWHKDAAGEPFYLITQPGLGLWCGPKNG